MLSMYVLGSFDLEVEGVMVDTSTWTRRSSRQLLQLLAIRKNHKIRKEEAMDLLWPDLPFDACANRYYMAVHSLRSALEPERSGRGVSRFVLSTGDFVSLNVPDQVRLDLDEFDTLANAIGKDCTDSAAYEKAIALYRGPLFADDASEDWLTARREDLRVRYARLVQAYSDHLLATGQRERAIEALRKLVDLDLTNEEAHRKLMYGYGVAGQRVEALRQFEALSRILAEKVGVKVDKQTEELAHAIRRGDLDAKPGAPAAEPVAAVPIVVAAPVAPMVERFEPPYGSDAIVARDMDLHRITELLIGGEVRLLTIHGLPGVGKSCVARQVAQLAQQQFDQGVLWVNMDGAHSFEGALENIRAAMSPLTVPQALGLPALIQVLKGMRLLMVLDHTDQLSCVDELVTELLRKLPHLVMLLTARQALNSEFEYRHFLGPFPIPAYGSSLEPVELLKNDAVRFFVRQIRKSDSAFVLDEQSASAVFDICRILDGMPVALRDAAARLMVWSLPELHTKLMLPAPDAHQAGNLRITKYPALLGAVNESVQKLDQAAADDFFALSVVQGSFTLGTAAAVCGRSDEQIEHSINALLGHGLLEARQAMPAAGAADSPRRGYYLLSVIRDYAFERMTAAGLGRAACEAHAVYYAQRMSAMLSAPLQAIQREGMSVRRNAETALVWTCSERLAELAWPLCTPLCEYWMAQGGSPKAKTLWQRVHDLFASEGDSYAVELGMLGLKIAKALLRDGHAVQAESLLALPVVRDAEASLRGASRAIALLARGQMLQYSGSHEPALALFSQAHAGLACGDDHREIAECKRLMAQSHGAAGRHQQALTLAREALSLARWHAPVEEVFLAAITVARQSLLLWRVADARAAMTEALALPVLPATEALIPELHMVEGYCLLHEGHADRAKSIFEQVQAGRGEGLGTECSAASFIGLGICAALHGQYGYANALLRQAQELSRSNRDATLSNRCMQLLAMVAIARNALDDLQHLLAELVQETAPNEVATIVAAADVVAMFAAHTGHVRMSRVLLRTGNMVRRRLGLVRSGYESVLLQRGGVDLDNLVVEDAASFGTQSGIERLYRSVVHVVGLVSQSPAVPNYREAGMAVVTA